MIPLRVWGAWCSLARAARRAAAREMGSHLHLSDTDIGTRAPTLTGNTGTNQGLP